MFDTSTLIDRCALTLLQKRFVLKQENIGQRFIMGRHHRKQITRLGRLKLNRRNNKLFRRCKFPLFLAVLVDEVLKHGHVLFRLMEGP